MLNFVYVNIRSKLEILIYKAFRLQTFNQTSIKKHQKTVLYRTVLKFEKQVPEGRKIQALRSRLFQ